jgi:high-affinity K+ transport system ATPase subunit B
VFNSDYTGQTNATIIAAMNAQFSDTGRSFSESFPYSGEAPVRQLDRETIAVSGDTVAITRGSAVVRDSGGFTVSLAAENDGDLVGVAFEDIMPDDSGIVQTSGHIHEDHLNITGTTTRTIGTTYDVAASGGAFEVGTDNPVLRVVDVRDSLAIFEII